MPDRPVVVIGNFDGVHKGHQALLRAAQELAPTRPLAALTFWPHPMRVIRPDKAPLLLCGLDDRVELLRRYGVDEVEVVAFDEALAQLTPEQFVATSPLLQRAALVVVGENFRFGHRAAGDVAELRRLGEGRFDVVGLPLVRLGGAQTSSTLIREALAAGSVEDAAEHLGRPFRFSGVVVRGDQRGRELGFPTANLRVPVDLAVPSDGVYAGWVTAPRLADPGPWPAAISVGTNPTFDGVEHRVESYVLDRDDLELYDEDLHVDFAHRLRGQVRFEGLDGLVAQMTADVRQARHLLR